LRSAQLSPFAYNCALLYFSLQLSKLFFIALYVSYFVRTRTLLIESQIYPLLYQLLCKLQPDDTLAEAEDLGIVAEDGTLDRVRIVSGDGPNAGNFICRNSYAETCAADEEGAICLYEGSMSGLLQD
jgi:hypothetical protein